jgi:hypothetical protein
VAVTLTATPSSGLEPGQSIVFTLAVSNLGPLPVDRLQIASSSIYDDIIDLSQASTDCEVMILTVVDTETGYYYYYYYSWYPTDASTLAVGETRTCQLRFALAPNAPDVVPFSFGVPDYYVDINPSNNVGAVTLQRAGRASSVPTLSIGPMILFGLLLVASNARMRRRSGGKSRFDRLCIKPARAPKRTIPQST